ncbi:centrosome microtubule-binding domain of Cep57-domain-containing protein [Dipodascopsis tothii]|uniref:centrosome microtubule-binding domain of Cep57-domain-containing protein n=1 Tax=Dipodascopsis tothii TaxID=44089 RepID=UPI0034CF8DAD
MPADLMNDARSRRTDLERRLERDLDDLDLASPASPATSASSRSSRFLRDDGDLSQEFLNSKIDVPQLFSYMDDDLEARMNASLASEASTVDSIELGRAKHVGSPDLGFTDTSLASFRKVSQRDIKETRKHDPFSPAIDHSFFTPGNRNKPYAAESTRRQNSPFDKRYGSLGKRSASHQVRSNNATEFPRTFTNPQDFMKKFSENEKSARKPSAAKAAAAALAATVNDKAFEFSGPSPVGSDATPTRLSFRIPDMTGISSLMEDEDDRLGKVQLHKPIKSISVSDSDQEILEALRTLRDRVQQLERKNAAYKATTAELEASLRQAKAEFEHEHRKTIMLEQKLALVQRDVQTSKNSVDREKVMRYLEKEKAAWEENTAELRSKVDSLQQKVTAQSREQRQLEDDRDEAIRSLSNTLDELNAAKRQNAQLKDELADLKSRVGRKLAAREAKERVHRQLNRIPGNNYQQKDIFDQTSEAESEEEEEPPTRSRRAAKAPKQKPRSRERASKKSRSKKIGQRAAVFEDPSPAESDASGSLEDYGDGYLSASEEEATDTSADATDETGDVLRPSRRAVNKANTEPAKSKTKSRPAKSGAVAQDQTIPKLRVNVQRILDTLSQHNPTVCSICSRRRGFKQAYQTPQKENRRDDDWADEDSVRPAVAPQTAVTSIIKQIEDEFKHLKLQYHSAVTKYEQLDPSIGKRKRKTLVQRIKELTEELESKADQIYSLYDVLHAPADDNTTMFGGCQADDDNLTKNLLGRHTWINI